jgi:hypothetical protein
MATENTGHGGDPSVGLFMGTNGGVTPVMFGPLMTIPPNPTAKIPTPTDKTVIPVTILVV